jgi:hypothetical protein
MIFVYYYWKCFNLIFLTWFQAHSHSREKHPLLLIWSFHRSVKMGPTGCTEASSVNSFLISCKNPETRKQHPLLLSYPSVCVRLPLDGVPWNLLLGASMRICLENPNLVKIGQKYRHFTWTPSYALLLSVTLNRHKALSSSEMTSGCQDSLGGTNITRTRHNITLYLHYLNCWH